MRRGLEAVELEVEVADILSGERICPRTTTS